MKSFFIRVFITLVILTGYQTDKAETFTKEKNIYSSVKASSVTSNNVVWKDNKGNEYPFYPTKTDEECKDYTLSDVLVISPIVLIVF